MWKGYEEALLYYGICTCKEWIKRGYKDTMLERFEKEADRLIEDEDMEIYMYNKPLWLGKRAFHASHRSNLLRKNKEWYSQFNWKEKDNLPYIWF